MATVEFIKKRIEGKEKEIEKLEKKMERILKAEATNWEVNPYGYYENDKKWTQRYLDDARAGLEEYKKQLETTMQKDASRNVTVIVKFLEEWKKRVTERYMTGLAVYFKEYEEVQKLGREYWDAPYGDPQRKEKEQKYEEARDIFHNKCRGYFERRKYYDVWYKREREHDVKVKDGEYEWLKPYCEYDKEEAQRRLQKDVEEEAKRKYDFIIERTNRIVGQITDASGLYIADNGELNGIIIGTNGKARVETITAGGYNEHVILDSGRHGQCFHFRVLVNRAK